MSLIQFNNSTIQKLHAVKFAFSLIIKSIKSPPYMNHHPSTSKLAITNPMASSRAPISSILFNPLISHRTNPYMSQLHLNLLLFLLSLLCFLFLPLKFSIHTICLFPSLDHFGFLLTLSHQNFVLSSDFLKRGHGGFGLIFCFSCLPTRLCCCFELLRASLSLGFCFCFISLELFLNRI